MKELINNILEKLEETKREFNNGIDLDTYENGVNEDYMKGFENGINMAVTLLKEDKSIEYKNYIVFILAYDLLNKELKESDQPECDLAYEECKRLAKEFMCGKFDNPNKSLLDSLIDFVDYKKENM